MGFIANAVDDVTNGIGDVVNTVLPGKVGDVLGKGVRGVGGIASAGFTIPFNEASDVLTGNWSKMGSDLIKPFTHGIDNITGAISDAIGNPFGNVGPGGGPQAPDNSDITNKNNALNAALQNQLNLQQQNSDKVKSDADSFKNNLPGYEAGQVSNATDQAKSALTNDIYNTKASANARGMTYSGLNTQGQQDAQVKESSKLAGDIQNINQQANTLSDQKQQNSYNAQNSVAQSQTQLTQARATQSQNDYQNALLEQQNQVQYYAGLMGAAGSASGGIMGLIGNIL